MVCAVPIVVVGVVTMLGIMFSTDQLWRDVVPYAQGTSFVLLGLTFTFGASRMPTVGKRWYGRFVGVVFVMFGIFVFAVSQFG